ncbi:hypothetical protein ET475_05990 [Microbacterium protaetiae]|uniref:Alpha/beta hydrolase n=1 Tax=Microbacterium protaetiae TaxID=2509458 RepID=A0A4P6EER1_9MICO|nr:hypothetical protein [Microbacterium protaetiae]QAY59579.1 hypothetical protein ET475_05990 [Microbacterium protaetiae]
MSDDITIRDGGVVAVDTESLRRAAARWAVLRTRLRDAAQALSTAARNLSALGPEATAVLSTTTSLIGRSAWMASSCADDLDDLVADLRTAADTYEVIELRARAAVHGGVGTVAARSLALMVFGSRHPEALAHADAASAARDLQVGAQLAGPSNGGVMLAPALVALASPLFGLELMSIAGALPQAAQGAQALIRMLGAGRIAPGMTLAGAAEPVRLQQTFASSLVSPPDGLADALGRIPDDDARVRIESYAMPDGSMRYAVYLAGTRDFVPGGDETDPWDMRSNLEMYFGQDSAAYEAVQAAMADAGVPPGAQVYLFGHSQGGMIADWLAVQGGYDVSMLVTAGSPTEAAVGDETLSVQLRHTDDVVQSLAAGGSDARVGAEGSMVVERAGDPVPGLQDLSVAAHHLTAYVATARMVDAAADPRAAQMRVALGELRGARSVAAAEYNAARVGAPVAPKPVPTPSPGPSPVPPPSSSPPSSPGSRSVRRNFW